MDLDLGACGGNRGVCGLTGRISVPVLQVSVLTDQVEAQGEKIRDLDLCLEEHREKLNATEDMLQQVISLTFKSNYSMKKTKCLLVE